MKRKLYIFLLAIACSAFTAQSLKPMIGHNEKKMTNQKTCLDQGYEVSEYQLMGAYNAPARYDVKNCWDFWIEGAFLYYRPLQEGMTIGRTVDTDGVINKVIDFDFDWTPAFNVGLGMNMGHDNWQIAGKYRRLEDTYTLNKKFPIANFTGTFYIPNVTFANDDEFKAKWKLSINIADLTLARPYYLGTKLVFNPFAGIRAAWFYQKYNNSFYMAGNDNNPYLVKLKSKSFGIGPRFGLEGNWLLGKGFKLVGNSALAILHTHYRLTYYKDQYSDPDKLSFINLLKKLNFLRPSLETEIGLAYGRYFNCNNWHFDIFLGYDFNVFWNQNLFPTVGDLQDPTVAKFSSSEDYFEHGFKLCISLDF